MKNNISYIKSKQRKITGIVTKKFREYYLTGGTALSFYFNHRFSEDLNFFTQDYRKEDLDRIMNMFLKRVALDLNLKPARMILG